MYITVKNYRCFSQKNPLKIELQRGITAYIGPNNSGKSTIFRFLFELRALWTLLSSADNFANAIKIGLAEIDTKLPDKRSIFCDSNNHNLEIEVDLRSANPLEELPGNHVQKLKCTIARDNPKSCIIKIYTSAAGNEVDMKASTVRPQSFDVATRDDPGNPFSYEGLVSAFKTLSDCVYLDANRFIASKFGGNSYDLIVGSSFVQQWGLLKTGDNNALRLKAVTLRKCIQDIFQFSQLEISSNTAGNDMVVVIDDTPYNLSEMGDGISQFILALGTAAIKEPSFILIDEPERGLHASMQIDFVTSLASYAKYGLMLTTHSVGLARSVSDCGIFSVKMRNHESRVERYEKESELPELLGMLNYSSYRDLGYSKILLVEGTGEVKVFQQFMQKFKVDHEVVILPLGGSSLIRSGVAHEISEICRIAKGSVFAVVDSERKTENEKLSQDREGFRNICQSLGIPCLVTHWRATDNYFSTEAIQSAFPGQNYTCLERYELIGRGRWKKSENWRIARHMSKDEIAATDIGQFIKTYLA